MPKMKHSDQHLRAAGISKPPGKAKHSDGLAP